MSNGKSEATRPNDTEVDISLKTQNPLNLLVQASNVPLKIQDSAFIIHNSFLVSPPGIEDDAVGYLLRASETVIQVTQRDSQLRCPQEESNLHLRFRKPLLYPLSYGDMISYF
jgi:hypothetical protein